MIINIENKYLPFYQLYYGGRGCHKKCKAKAKGNMNISNQRIDKYNKRAENRKDKSTFNFADPW